MPASTSLEKTPFFMMSKLATLCFLLWSAIVLSQPANDNCAGAVQLGLAPACPIPQVFTNKDATASNIGTQNIPTCFSGGSSVNRDVWFAFQTPAGVDIPDQNYSLSVTGTATNGIRNPQIALYRGFCQTNGLAEWACASAAAGSQTVKLDVVGLIPGITYFIRVNDYSASASPNWGDFRLCIEGRLPTFRLVTDRSSSFCNGVLYDSGGPNGNYSRNENLSFSICPNSIHQCIVLQVDSFDIERQFDRIKIFSGNGTQGVLITELNGIGNNIEVQAPPGCVTVQFVSDESVHRAGFKLSWSCSPDPCNNLNLTSCEYPHLITQLPYSQSNLTTCNSGNSISGGPCGGDFLRGYDHVFAYDSPGDECIQILVKNASINTGVGVYPACPDVATECLGFNISGFFDPNVIIPHVFIEEPGRYYIVVANDIDCTDFDISVKRIECPLILPSAAQCADALPITGCDITVPSTIAVAQRSGDANFIRDGVNNGCWGDIIFPNYTWFYFQAQADGKFGFLMKSADQNEFSDIDINIWGPLPNMNNACTYAATRQPIRSTFADDNNSYDLTGLVDQSPITGRTIGDTCEDEFGDGFIKTMNVRPGEYYLVLINDYDGIIYFGGITIDFSPTTPGVLGMADENFAVSPDTVVCAGDRVQLLASGGLNYRWLSSPDLSCINCPNPVATPNGDATYQVIVKGVCETDTLSTSVKTPKIDLGSDQSVCQGETVRLRASGASSGTRYNWSAPVGGSLSCTDCALPLFTLPQNPGDYLVVVQANFGRCIDTDTLLISVAAGSLPQYEILDDQTVCRGDSVRLGGQARQGYTYSWVDARFNLISRDANPHVVVNSDFVYYLSVKSPDCPVARVDSVRLTVADPPVLSIRADTTICEGISLSLNSAGNPTYRYDWRSLSGNFQDTVANPLVTPSTTTTYEVTATSHPACAALKDTLTITVLGGFSLEVSPDSVFLCRGEQIELFAKANATGGSYLWSTGANSPNIVVTPDRSTVYSVTYISPQQCDTLQGQSVVTLGSKFSIDGIEPTIGREDFYEGEEFSLHVLTDPATIAGAVYAWKLNGQALPQAADTILLTLTEAGSYQVEVLLTDANGCTETKSITIEVQRSIFEFPNVFTPDGDQYNQFFRPVIKGAAVKLAELRVFNRWGKMVFQQSGQGDGWDGTFNGQHQPSDVYAYTARVQYADGREEVIRGDVTLLR
jgi:gliding motility-associated-like protein